MPWPINSMNNDIDKNFLLYGTAKEIWDAAQQNYSKLKLSCMTFVKKISVTQYFNTLTQYWQHLDMFDTHAWKCADDAATYRNHEGKKDFQILIGTKPLPSIREVFSKVQREESRRKVMMGSQDVEANTPLLDSSALAV